jgi:hypothetical protein
MDVDFAEIYYDMGMDEGEEPAKDNTSAKCTRCAKCARAFKSYPVSYDRG